ncbi:MAG TPA: tRNA (guanosine(37)-N1)-methyltransferase TrmD [Trebonia sp.]|nr:tRNA (guanosine(37)-N1)-methyltransferase TrmD [Trebonia sp.]
MRVDIITIFPDYFGLAGQPAGPLGVSLIGKAAARGDLDFRLHDLRRWTTDVHHTVDDTPFGGGPGMVMKPDVWGNALDDVLASAGPARLIIPTPSGRPFTQELAASYAAQPRLAFACGRYEGIDSRVAADTAGRMPVDEVSIGDYVLAGGEVAVCVILEAVCRLLPGVLGNEQSAADDSFGQDGSSGLLEGPVYTRPRTWRGQEVPDILLSGNHQAIARWRRDQALRRTAAVRPDLVSRLAATGATAAGTAAGTAGGTLDKRDRQVLSDAGFPVGGESMAH